MSAVETLREARAVGIHLEVEGEDLLLEASAPPPTAVLDALSQHKTEIVAILRRGHDCWSSEDWRLFFKERAEMAEFAGGLPRNKAEARAFECCIIEWLNRNPSPLYLAVALGADVPKATTLSSCRTEQNREPTSGCIPTAG